MAGLVYPQYPVFPGFRHPYRPHPPFYKPKQPYWKPPYKGAPGPMKPTNPLDCLDGYRWAQLKALLSQLGPEFGLGRRFTREVGVQVNPRVDACIQCSLGPRTLKSFKGGPFHFHAVPGQHAGLGIITPVRFPRTIAVYSRLSDRRLFTVPTQTPEGEDGTPKESIEEDVLLRRPAFQFLEQKYGFFHCKGCQVRWESAYVWCVSGTNKVYFKQFCHKCQKGHNPYFVESIECKKCKKAWCPCPERRHIDLKRPHCQELCGRCKGQRLSCDKTYSFKYII
ncbi:hypothetical protein XENTR_v10007423 [Xenopus tropicalis]|uniref:Zygote arrest protein 1 n=1 Tax=Xenopus tropicalis TaxID=8364 RepID=A0A7D9NLK6_XENTR|nr:zygote arrest protein 1 [Xenopus tropicalis]KAE8628246.1 hypothetical protein XENTR_v10007423 [Xenopus tropicalis]|eukprot:XP_002942409.1 PREDICTED: zygote arrest protein 1-like [Xenopus tropicalis]